ncbi:helix-turn-helix domain-containing protein [Serratia proteamaculans]|uniref:helix-turn-helix domain-containing protein n=1 Tax=Serratia proteamaculans TaxID=28151 RepID=UPI0021C7255B|nr:helix-turn-helix transcriptional regulator [Serratia proteamaculans]
MTTLSRDYAKKLRQIRKAEGLTQKAFAELVGVGLGTVKSYETGHQSARSEIAERVISVRRFQKYTLWLTIDQTAPAAGQIAPPLSPDGHDETKLHQSDQNVG